MASKQEVHDESALLSSFGANPHYDEPDTYWAEESFFGEGKYPPDWPQRRNVVWWLQDGACGRCGADTDDGGGGNVHHVQHISDGGGNELDNLVGLCHDCHALMHPTVSSINGDYTQAPAFPSADAQPEVAVVRRLRNEDLATDFEKLDAESSPAENRHAVTGATYATSPSDARAAATADGFNDRLLAYGRVPENSYYDTRRLRIATSLEGLRGVVSPFEPDVAVTSDAEVTEDVDGDDSDREVLLSDDATTATVDVRGGDGETVREAVTFSEDDLEHELSVSVAPPPLSLSTAGAYARGTLRLAGLAVLSAVLFVVLPLIVGAIATAVLPTGPLPTAGVAGTVVDWVVGVVLLFVLGSVLD